ncbi:MAG: hypothetical protein ACR2HO_11470 [Rubrobacteraceae bacterium]
MGESFDTNGSSVRRRPDGEVPGPRDVESDPGPRMLLGSLLGILLVSLLVLTGRFGESPEEALEAAFRAANEGDYETADGYLSEEMTNELEGDTRKFWDSVTKDGTVTEINT